MRDLKCILVLWLTPFVFVIPPWPTAYITYKLYHRVLKVDSICVYVYVPVCAHVCTHTRMCVFRGPLFFPINTFCLFISLFLKIVYLFFFYVHWYFACIYICVRVSDL